MDKNEFDIDFDFEEEYGFDPKDFLSGDDDFNYSDFLDDDDDSDDPTREYSFTEDAPEEQTEDDTEEAYEEEEYTEDPGDEDVKVFGEEETVPEEETEEPEPETGKNKKKKGGMKLPQFSFGKGGKKAPKVKEEADPEKPAKKGAVSKLIEMYMEPITKAKSEAEVMDPLDPKYIRRKKRERVRIFKEVYLPAIISCVSLFLIISFIAGSISNAWTVKKNMDSAAQVEAQAQANAAGAAEMQFKKLMAEVESLVVVYDYDGAIKLLESYTGDNDKFRQQVVAKRSELLSEQRNLVELKDTSGIPNLSFHVLMADAARACNKDVSGADLAGLYNKNFVSVEEFSRILNQLYNANYVLVDFNSFITSVPGVDGNSSFFAKSIFLPQGKKPIMITETMVNYFEYMVDPDKDGKPDGKGHGFANKLVIDGNGDIKASYVDADGVTQIGNYDLVPVLEAFIQEHPDFSYQGARAILAVTGTEGVFGYRTNTSYVARFGQAFYDNEVADAKKLVAALRDKGYTIASYTYSNQAYRGMNTLQIQAEIQNWTNQITPVLGEVDTIVFARASDIEAYSGTTFNVLYNSGLRFFLNNGSSPRVDVNTTFIRQTRLMVTGEAMAWYASQFSEYFDCNVVIDLASRGNTPAKS